MSQNESHENESAEIDPGRRKGVLRVILKKLSLLFLAVVFSSSVGFAYLYFYFPKDKAKKTILAQLQKRFHVTLRFQGLNFNPFKGLELTDVSVRGPGDVEMPMVKLDRILFKMEFWDLFRGKVTIRRAVVDKPLISLERRDGKWNFERLLDGFNKKSQTQKYSGLPAKETTTDKEFADDHKSQSSFALPMEIHLEEFSLSQLNLSCVDDAKIQAFIGNVNVNCKLKLGKGVTTVSAMLSVSPISAGAENISFLLLKPKKITINSAFYVDLSLKTVDLNKLLLSGKLSLGNGTIKFDKRKDTLQLSSAINTTIDLASGHVRLNSLDISSENILWFKMNGEAKNILNSPSFILNVEGASVLESAFRKFREILPLKRAAGSILLSAARLEGQLGKNLSFKGNLAASDLSIESDVVNLSGTKVTVNILSGEARGKKLRSLDARIEQKTDNIEIAGIKIKDKLGPVRLEQLKQTANIKIKQGNIAQINYEAAIKGGSVGSSGALSALKLSLDARTAGNHLFKPEDISGKLNIQCGDISLQPVALHGAVGGLSFDLHEGDIRKIAADIDVNVEGVKYTAPDIGTLSLPLKFKTSFVANAAQGKQRKKYTLFDIKTIKSHIDVGAVIADLNASKSVNDDFSLLLSMKSEFEKLVPFIPPALSEKIGKGTAHGSMVSNTKITGKLKENYKNSLLNISEDLQVVGLSCDFPKKKVYLEPSEIYLHAVSDYRVGGDNTSAKVRGDISIGAANFPKFSMSSLQTSFQANTDGTIYKISSRINGNIIALKLLPPLLLSKPEKQQMEFTAPTNLTFGLKIRQNLEDGSLAVDRLKVEIPSLLLLKAKGSVEKWGENFGVDTSLSIESMNTLYSILPERFRKDMPITTSKGKLNISIDGDYRGGSGVKFKLLTNAKRFSASKEGVFSFSGLKTNILVEKDIVFVGADEKAKTGADIDVPLKAEGTSGFEKADNEHSSSVKNSMFLQSLAFKDMLFKKIFLNFYFRDDHVNVDSFSLGFLGGSIGGSMFSGANDSALDSKIKLEFSGLDLNQLIEGKNKLIGDAKITGGVVLNFEGIGKNDDEEIDISLLDLNIVITHIGQDAMGRLLLFFDPDEENSSVVKARRYLKYEKPYSFSIGLQHGSLTLALQFRSRLLAGKKITLDIFRKVPISKLKNFGVFKENVEKIKPVLNILKIVFAKRLVVGQGGKL